MPYATIDDLPPAARHLPLHAREIFRAAFNAAWEEYGGHEATAFRVAWAAVKKSYKKRGDTWVAK